MKRIVAAPTAGSCGVIPAVLISYEEVVAESEESGDDLAEDGWYSTFYGSGNW